MRNLTARSLLAKISLVSVGVIALLVASTMPLQPVKAVDFSAIEAQVKQQAAQRQPSTPAPTSSDTSISQPPTVRVERDSETTTTAINHSKTKSSSIKIQPEVIHWSAVNGLIRLRTLNGQLLLSFF